MGLDRESPTPLYLQLRDILASRITEGSLGPGDALPSERQLCDDFGLSRTTVREALRQLARLGMTSTVPGRGAFVRSSRPELAVRVSLRSFVAELCRQGMEPSSKVLGAKLIESPSPSLIDRMALEPGDEVVKLEQLGWVDDMPLALHTHHLNHRFCPGILRRNLSQAPVFDLLPIAYDLTLAYAEEEAYATLANERERELLELSHPCAVLRTERTTFLDTGDVIGFTEASYRGELYRLKVAVERMG